MRRPVPLLLTLALLVLAPVLVACVGEDTQGCPSTFPDPAAPVPPPALSVDPWNLHQHA